MTGLEVAVEGPADAAHGPAAADQMAPDLARALCGMTARGVWTGWRLVRSLILHDWACAERDSLMSPGQLSIARVNLCRAGLGGRYRASARRSALE